MIGVINRIKERFDAEQQQPTHLTSREQVPASYEAITPDWLTAVLCTHVPGAKVISHELGAVDNGTSNRRRIHLTYNEAGCAANLPPSVFCKASQALLNRIMLGISHAAPNEVNFYNHVRPHINVSAPKAFFANYDDETCSSIVVLEDIANEVTFFSERTPVDFERACRQLRVLARLHGQSSQREDLAKLDGRFLTWPALWLCHVELDLAEYSDKGLLAAAERNLIPAGLLRRRKEVWPRTMESAELMRSLPAMLTHNDVHLKNWYAADTNGALGLSDWQCLAVGHWSRDFAYAVSTSLTIEDRRKWEKELLQFYLNELQSHGGPAASMEDAWRYYRQQLLTSLAFWTGTLTHSTKLPDMQPEHTSLVFIERIAAAIDDLDALGSFN